MAWQEERDQIVKRETRLNQLSSKAQPAHSRKRKRHQLHEQFDELFKVRVAPGSINTAWMLVLIVASETGFICRMPVRRSSVTWRLVTSVSSRKMTTCSLLTTRVMTRSRLTSQAIRTTRQRRNRTSPRSAALSGLVFAASWDVHVATCSVYCVCTSCEVYVCVFRSITAAALTRNSRNLSEKWWKVRMVKQRELFL